MARLWAVLIADVALVGALIAVGLGAHSLGVWAEGADYLADGAAVGVALIAIRLHAPSASRPQGSPNATRCAAVVTAGWLLVGTLLVAASAAHRLVTGARHVDGLPVLVVSGIAAPIMLAGALLLGGDVDDDDAADGATLTVRAVLLDTAADAAAAAGVAGAGGVILATGSLYWLDPTVALGISLAAATQAARLLARIRRTHPIPGPSRASWPRTRRAHRTLRHSRGIWSATSLRVGTLSVASHDAHDDDGSCWPSPEAAAVGSFSLAAEAKVVEVQWNALDEDATVHITVGPAYDYYVHVVRERGGWVEMGSFN